MTTYKVISNQLIETLHWLKLYFNWNLILIKTLLQRKPYNLLNKCSYQLQFCGWIQSLFCWQRTTLSSVVTINAAWTSYAPWDLPTTVAISAFLNRSAAPLKFNCFIFKCLNINCFLTRYCKSWNYMRSTFTEFMHLSCFDFGW